VTRFRLVVLGAIALAIVAILVWKWPHHQSSAVPSDYAGPADIYPNRSISPGEADPDATVDKVCTPGYSSEVRDVSQSTKNQVFELYGIPESKRYTIVDGHKKPNYEVDHIISLELGGSNSIKNLFPQPYEPRPGAYEKDLVENWLHRQVCSEHTMSLQEAQEAISSDWYKIYLKIKDRPRKRKRNH
jgi:hypothetical protein